MKHFVSSYSLIYYLRAVEFPPPPSKRRESARLVYSLFTGHLLYTVWNLIYYFFTVTQCGSVVSLSCDLSCVLSCGYGTTLVGSRPPRSAEVFMCQKAAANWWWATTMKRTLLVCLRHSRTQHSHTELWIYWLVDLSPGLVSKTDMKAKDSPD